MRLALVTSAALPQLDPDDQPLLPAAAALGFAAEPAVWDDPEVAWQEFDAILVRSPWDYYRRHEEFLAWAERVERHRPMFNPASLLRWNTDKHYLGELARRGAPVVPTRFVEAGERADLAAVLDSRGWREAIVKPAVSADSWETIHVERDELVAGQDHLARLTAERTMMIQPFLASVEEYGERCLVFIDGELSHAVRKNSLTRGGRHAGLPEGVAVAATPEEIATARDILALAPQPAPLYARVDLVRDERDRLVLLELELAEPTLFFTTCAGAAERLLTALLARLRTPAHS